MAPRPTALAAALFLVVSAVCFANPLYLESAPDRGSILLDAERTDPAAGAADLTAAATHQEDLPPVARYAVAEARTNANGTYAVARDAPPLTLRLLDAEWRYLGSQEAVAVFRPHVTVGADSTTLRLENRSLAAVESDLGLTPPGRLNETDHPKEVSWLAHESSAVVLVSAFADPWRDRLARAVRTGTLTAPNRNDADALAPLGGEVSFVVRDGAAARVTVEETNATVRLGTSPVSDETVVEETDVRVVETTTLDARTRRVVVEAIESGHTRAHRDEVAVERLDGLEGRLVRHENAYYVLHRGHADDFDLTPLFRLVLFGVGAVSLLVAGAFGWLARRD